MHRLGTKPGRLSVKCGRAGKLPNCFGKLCYQIVFGCFGFKSPYIAFITRILKINFSRLGI